ncbi:MAG: orotidine-5'-phosphate decarboxylase [Hyphomicrobium sp.]
MAAARATPHSDKLIVALDVPNADAARALIAALGDSVSFYKIGLELVFSGGLDLARDLKAAGKRVFLDMKLLDIGNTEERAVASAAALGVDFLTIHGHDRKTIAAAVRGKGTSATKILAVTVLTSLDAADLAEQGTAMQPADLVVHRARLSSDGGADGVIASGQEAAAVRAATRPGFLIVTPGIRLPGGEAGDQTRITTPEQALRSGADYLVVGRPITAAESPRAAAETFQRHIASA